MKLSPLRVSRVCTRRGLAISSGNDRCHRPALGKYKRPVYIFAKGLGNFSGSERSRFDAQHLPHADKRFLRVQ